MRDFASTCRNRYDEKKLKFKIFVFKEAYEIAYLSVE